MLFNKTHPLTGHGHLIRCNKLLEVEVFIMHRLSRETVGVRYTGWAALDRDPLDDRVEFTCPYCRTPGKKAARRARAEYHFTDGFVQDLQGESTVCRDCKRTFRVVPVVLLHHQDEKRRFEAVFAANLEVSRN
jgi:uncharacterized protein YbaR (Trm112 family)